MFTLEEITERRNGLANGHAMLTNRIAELRALLSKALHDQQATEGAVKECDHWIAEFQKKETKQ